MLNQIRSKDELINNKASLRNKNKKRFMISVSVVTKTRNNLLITVLLSDMLQNLQCTYTYVYV